VVYSSCFRSSLAAAMDKILRANAAELRARVNGPLSSLNPALRTPV
jgi:hypothetical protein